MKETFQKYGFTVTAIIFAPGTVIGAIIVALTNSLKAMGIGVGKGLQEIGKKNRILLPSLLGSIVSFVFIAAVQAVCFLAEHTWLLILATMGQR